MTTHQRPQITPVQPRTSTALHRATACVNYNQASHVPPQIVIEVENDKGQQIIHPDYQAVEVELHDASQVASTPNFAQSGLQFCTYPTQVSHFDKDLLNSERFKQSYDTEICHLIKQVCHAKEAFVFDHTIRDDKSNVRAPAKHVHSDYSPESARTRLYDFLNENTAQQWEAEGFGIVNVWRPIGHRVEQSPLCFIESTSVEKKDWTAVNLIYPDRQGQVMGMYHNPTHQWLYLPEMIPDEVVIFCVANNTSHPIIAHSAVDLTHTPNNARPRRSIETRVLVKF